MRIDLSSLGWNDQFAAAYAKHDRGGQWPARVSRVDRGVCTALGADGPVRASLAGGLLAAAAPDLRRLPCVGDWVVVRTWPDARLTLEAVLPRRTAVVRPVTGGESVGQVLAANIDTLAIVEPADAVPDPARIERLLALARESGAPPILLLTKIDLVRDPAAIAARLRAGVDLFPVSARTGAGLSRLKPFIGYGMTLGLLGRTGAGTSSLVDALAGATVMKAQALPAGERGGHTATYRSLVPLPTGGVVLTTPGDSRWQFVRSTERARRIVIPAG